ncbi:rhodanese-like domain-containing protein 17 isoform X4 [Vitis vinifera]|uniref:rhodanese-like domain-containing protein 17 isoform X4 n=1 Tax=Vitis vinifera TaxID=29760 RepID=UPI00053F8A8B|nr:rhodanese-like domain-containing protein 17 isoform X4 [Vitis vinifera]XP_019074739.1 rhodanese-like domain-containing protein 17 isoform X4 [Vitis vinifera]|eukprot:XP_010649019.1 PREDICTED: rhodanese-like domain-containing protein 17 isoform X2 [Vitis vinifera]
MASPSSATEVVTIDVHAAKELTNSGYRYLDVRTVEEFKKGHADVENILNIPYLFTTPEAKMIWMWVWVSERLKIPEFLEQVQSACSKEDHLVVVG